MSVRSDTKPSVRKTLVPIAVVDKSAIGRAGLSQMLQVGGFRVVAGASRLEDIPEKLFRCETNQLILLSLGDDGAALLTQIRALKDRHDSIRIVVLAQNLHARELLSILEAGVNCVLFSDEICLEILTKSLELVLLGEVIFPLGLLNDIKDWLQPSKESLAKPVPHVITVSQAESLGTMQNEANIHLSDREKAILRQLMLGASNKRIARELNVAEATIKVHVRAVLRKIPASNRTQAAMWAHKFLGPIAESDISDPDPVSGQRKFAVDIQPKMGTP